MGYFDFVTPDLGGDTEPTAPVPPTFVPQGWRVRKKGNDYWTNDETWADPGDELRPPDERGTEASPDVKPYTQRRGEATSKVFADADKIIDKYSSVNPALAEQVKREIRTKPDDAAKSIEKFYDALHAAKTAQNPWLGGSIAKQGYDPEFRDLENSVRSLRALQRGPEEKTLQGGLAESDLPALRQQLDQLTKDIATKNVPEAVSKRGEEENKAALGIKQQKAAELAKRIQQLEAVSGQGAQQPTAAPPSTANTGTNIAGTMGGETTYYDDNGQKIPYELWQKQHEDLKGSIDGNIKGSGRDPKQFRQAMIAGAKKLEQTMGVDTANLKDPVPFSRALLTGLQIFDPQGIILQQLSQDLQPNASAGGGQQTTSAGSGQGLSATKTTPEEDLHTKNLAAMRDQRRSLYQQLGQTPELNNWFGVLTFIFLSVITRSPSVAASILGISQRQGNLKAQLDLIEKDMHDEAFQLKQAQHEGDIARKMAADRALHQSDKADDYKRELMKMYLNHHAILLREAQRHPEGGEAYKRLDKDFARYSSMESSAHSEMMRADKDRNDPFADDAHKAQAEKDYQNSRKVWLFWSNKRKELNQTLEEMHVGGAGASGIEETPQ